MSRAAVGARVRAARLLPLALGGLALALVALEWRALEPAMREAARALYRLGAALNLAVAEPLNRLRLGATLPLAAPLLLGLMGATAPCQLSTGVAALAHVARDGRPGGALERAGAFLAARVLLYAALGAVAMYALGGNLAAPGPFFVSVRRALGPLTLLAGLATLGLIRPRLSLGGRASARLRALAEGRGGTLGAFALGLAYGLAFCPTLFLLFFGLTVPLALASPLGFLYPAAFALGMTLPLLGLAWLLSSARGGPDPSSRERLSGLRRWNRLATPVAGATFVLVGLHDTFVYWLL